MIYGNLAARMVKEIFGHGSESVGIISRVQEEYVWLGKLLNRSLADERNQRHAFSGVNILGQFYRFDPYYD